MPAGPGFGPGVVLYNRFSGRPGRQHPLKVYTVLDPKVVDHVAMLARLALTEEEKARIGRQLSQILEHFKALSDLDTRDIPPTAQVIPLRNTLRDDSVRPSLTQEQVLANAPRVKDGQIRVPAVLKDF